MSKKFSNLDGEDRKNIEEELDTISQSMGMTSFESYGTSDDSIGSLKDLIGLCSDCKSLNYCKSEFGSVLAKCEFFNMKLTGQNRIVECNLHSPKNALTLNEMYAIAYLIEPKDEAIKGFISNDPKFKGKPKKKEVKT